jgi:asparagine synthase (glutamine-hydrolysing)
VTGYVVLHWSERDRVASRRVAGFREGLLRLGWSVLADRPGWYVAVQHADQRKIVRILDDGGTVVIGSVFDRAATDAGLVRDFVDTIPVATFKDRCTGLTKGAWGSYIAIGVDRATPNRLGIFRDPIGSLECATWCCEGVRVVSSRSELLLALAPPADLAIAWSRVAELLVHPGSVREALPFVGIDTAPPGTIIAYDGEHVVRDPVWRVPDFCLPSAPPRVPRAAEIAHVVDACVAAWITEAGNAAGELSGGLDSAIIAAAATRADPAAVRQWFHYSTNEIAGDERIFAAAVAQHLDLPLAMIERDERHLDPDALATMPVALRPGLGSVSLYRDRDLAARVARLGSDTILTGHGGDAVFFQPATALVAADLWSDARRVSEKRAAVIDIATWTRGSVWTVLKAMLVARIRRRALRIPGHDVPFLGRDIGRGAYRSPWLEGIDRLPPAKQLQIWSLANSRSAFGPSWSSQVARVVHPLMSQPIVEHVLALPTIALTFGRRDRGLAREAFAGRLPATVIERRGKGDLTPYFGQILAASTAFLKDFLLDGVLVANGVLDRRRLEPMLTPDFLMQHDLYSRLITALILEHWGRAWHTKLLAMTTLPLCPPPACTT